MAKRHRGAIHVFYESRAKRFSDMRRMPKPKPDPSQEAARAVERVTDSDPVNGEDLLGSPKLKRQLAAAKKRLLARSRR